MPLSRILRSATLDNATVFGLSKILGSVEVGKRADLTSAPASFVFMRAVASSTGNSGKQFPRQSA
jgi:cytosine/adenosine deaminase-related metal-dependent hydrolase